LVQGVAFKKTFSYAGFEMQPKTYKNPKIALLNIELELKAERDNAEVRLENVEVCLHKILSSFIIQNIY
jgi:T-complex protein 1 subunit eta